MQVSIGNPHSDAKALCPCFYNAVPSVFSSVFVKIITVTSVLYGFVIDKMLPQGYKMLLGYSDCHKQGYILGRI